ERVGSLINATFGNAVELIVSHHFVEVLDHRADIDVQVGCLAVSHGEISFAQTMTIGSVLSDILLVSYPFQILIRDADQLSRFLAAAFLPLLSTTLQQHSTRP